LAFAEIALDALPQEALREVLAVSEGELESWARRWQVQAPCILKSATELRESVARSAVPLETLVVGRALRESFGTGSGPPIPWLEERQRLNALRPTIERRTLSDKVLPTYQQEYAARHLAQDEEFLAPLEADPAVETMTNFRQRAEDHYLARSQRLLNLARECKFEVPPLRHAPELRVHAHWLVQYQLGGKTFAAIAEASAATPEAVQRACRRMAAMIQLELRQAPPGRPTRRRRVPK
jgi:hypothetical protein